MASIREVLWLNLVHTKGHFSRQLQSNKLLHIIFCFLGLVSSNHPKKKKRKKKSATLVRFPDSASCELSLLLVLILALGGFSPGTPVFPSPQRPTLLDSNISIWKVSQLVLGSALNTLKLNKVIYKVIFYDFVPSSLATASLV